MEAYFTKETAKKLNIKTNWEALSLEIENMAWWNKHYSVKVAIFDKDENDVTHDYYDIDYIKNKKEILEYFLK